MTMNTSLEDLASKLSKELDLANEQLKKFSCGTSKFNKMLSIGQSDGNKRGLGFNRTTTASTSSNKVVFVPSTQKIQSALVPQVKVNKVVTSQAPALFKSKFSRFIPKCFHSGLCLNVLIS